MLRSNVLSISALLVLVCLCLQSYLVQSFTPSLGRIHRNVHNQQQSQRLLDHATPLRMSSSEAATEEISIDAVTAELEQVKLDFDAKLAEATTVQQAEDIRREYLGKKGPVNKVMGYMRSLSNEDKPKLGAVVNEIKDTLEKCMADRKSELEVEEIEARMADEYIDVTMPGTRMMADIGRRHPLSMTMDKAVDIFTNLGYDTVTECDDSPEIETDYYCFEALNCPKDHPARDMQDTFYLTGDREWMLRTHTSAVQIRQLEKRKPPLRVVSPGRVYRRDDIDATHSLMFHQVEILALEKRGELNLGHLKGTIEHFLCEMLGPNIEIRFRGSYFPFTEPSMEVDVFFKGRWMEVLGCGMVDPNVLKMAGVDPEEYSGFAAGFGVERFAMVIHGIADLREFYKSDKRFLQQFPHYYDDGLIQFLEGNTEEETAVDPRGETVPDEIVDSIEELIELNKKKSQVESPSQATPKQESQQPQQQQSSSDTTNGAASTEIDISKLDIRVGVIQKAWEHTEADRLYCEEIDIGEGEPRQIASGLREHYTLDEFQAKRVLVLSNLKARKLVGFQSHGMVLCASDSDGKVKLIEPPADAVIGERVFVKGYDGEPATENQVVKKKMLEAIFPDLSTNSEGVACYKNIPLTTSAGPCMASELKNSPIS